MIFAVEQKGEKMGRTLNEDDAVSRQAVYTVIEEVLYETTKGVDNWYGLLNDGVRTLPSAQPETHEERTEMHACDLISKRAVEHLEIIRCKDCKYYEIAWLQKDGTDNKRYKPSICVRGRYGIVRKPDWFCADAERRKE